MPEKSDMTHDEIAKPLQRDDILGSLEDARAGQRIWRDLFDEGPKRGRLAVAASLIS
jgi:hypothetical protein